MKPASALVLLLIAFFSFSQERSEWLAQIDTVSNDTIIVDLYQKLARSYQGRDKDSLVKYAQKALLLAEEMNYPKAMAGSFNLMGNANFLESNYDTAIYYYTEGYNIAASIDDTLRKGSLLGNVGMVLTYQGKYDTSIQVLLEARAIRESVDDPRTSSTVNNLGNAYHRLGDDDKALEYYKEAAELKEERNQTRSLSNTLNNIGIILKRQGKYEEAITYYNRSLEIAEEFEDIPKQANAHNNLGTLYRDGDIDNAKSEYHFQKAIEKKTEIGDKAGLFNSLVNYAELLSTFGRSQEAFSMLERAEALESLIGESMYTINGLQMKAFILADLNRFEDAYMVYREAYVKRIDAMNEDRNQKIAEWETKFETAKKEAEIERLSLASELQKSEIENIRRTSFIIIVSAIIIVGLLVAFFIQHLKKKRAEHLSQELQIEALKNRFTELHTSPAEMAVQLHFEDLNQKLNTPLTIREFEVLRSSLEGKTNTEISDALSISVSTVKFHLRNTYSKMGVGNRKEAFKYMLNA